LAGLAKLEAEIHQTASKRRYELGIKKHVDLLKNVALGDAPASGYDGNTQQSG
jgi:hypothetical protein